VKISYAGLSKRVNRLAFRVGRIEKPHWRN